MAKHNFEIETVEGDAMRRSGKRVGRRQLLKGAIACGALAIVPYNVSAAAEEEGFRPLFDGKSFAGWKTNENTPKSWRVEKGLLVLTGGSNHLFTEESFGDFVIRFQWRAIKKGFNSGFLFHGHQIQLADGSAGMLFGRKDAPAVPKLHNPPGQWNEWEVACAGTKLTLKVNGKLAWEIDDLKPRSTPIGIEAEGHAIEFRNLRIKTAP